MTQSQNIADVITEIANDIKALQDAPGGGGQSLRIAQVRNTNATSNLNHGTAWQDIVIAGEVDYLFPDFTPGATGIICAFTGFVRCTVHIGYTVAGARINIRVRPAVAGVGQPIVGKSGYVRNSGGHNEASCTAVQYISVQANDEVTLQTSRESSASTATPGDAGGCMILLERWA